MKIILASNSPRRADLLKMAGISFVVKSKDVPEVHPENVLPDEIPAFLARQKAGAFCTEILEDELVIGADTVVILGDEIYEKPLDREDAIKMLSALSGKTHRVVTGVCLLSAKEEITFSDTTYVTFNSLTPTEIAFYVDHFKPYDKAGSYACQEWIGAVAIQRFEGDYFNVVGLPVNRVYQALKKLGYSVL
jgi:septum formation protein